MRKDGKSLVLELKTWREKEGRGGGGKRKRELRTVSITSQKATCRHELISYLTTFSSLLHPLTPPPPPPPPSSQCAREGARCDYSLFLGASNSNATSLPHLSSQALALKMYLNTTFSTLKLDSMETWMKVHFNTLDVAAAFCVISSTCRIR